MVEDNKSILRESLISRVACCQKNIYGIVTPEGKKPEFIVRGNRMKILHLWVKHGDTLWTTQTFRGHLIMRNSKNTAPGQFYLGDSNWTHQHSSADPYPDMICIALLSLPSDDSASVGFKGVFNTECSTACIIQDSALANILIWEGRQFEKSTNMITGEYVYETKSHL